MQSVLTYGTETWYEMVWAMVWAWYGYGHGMGMVWAMKAVNLHSLKRAERIMVRLYGVSLKDKKRNEVLYL